MFYKKFYLTCNKIEEQSIYYNVHYIEVLSREIFLDEKIQLCTRQKLKVTFGNKKKIMSISEEVLYNSAYSQCKRFRNCM